MIFGVVLTRQQALIPLAPIDDKPLLRTFEQLRALRALKGAPRYSLDTIEVSGRQDVVDTQARSTERVPVNQSVAVTGWAIDRGIPRLAQSVSLDIDGKLLIPADYGGPRADVAKAFGINALSNSGFSVEIPAGLLTAGVHRIDLLVVSADGLGYYRVNQRIILNQEP
jgi:hypothetical protein